MTRKGFQFLMQWRWSLSLPNGWKPNLVGLGNLSGIDLGFSRKNFFWHLENKIHSPSHKRIAHYIIFQNSNLLECCEVEIVSFWLATVATASGKKFFERGKMWFCLLHESILSLAAWTRPLDILLIAEISSHNSVCSLIRIDHEESRKALQFAGFKITIDLLFWRWSTMIPNMNILLHLTKMRFIPMIHTT